MKEVGQRVPAEQSARQGPVPCKRGLMCRGGGSKRGCPGWLGGPFLLASFSSFEAGPGSTQRRTVKAKQKIGHFQKYPH